MANSLREQMLKAGLVDEKQAKKAGQEVRKSRKSKRKSGKAPAPDETKLRLEAERQAKADRDRELNRAREEERRERETQAQVRQIVERHRIERDEGDVTFSFQDGATVRSLKLSQTQRDALVAGSLAVVTGADAFELIPGPIAERIATRAPDAIACWHKPERSADEPIDEDDPYAGYEVPDDLMW